MVSAPGGHLVNAISIAEGLRKKGIRITFAIHDYAESNLGGDAVIPVPHSDRDWRIVLQFFVAFSVLFRLRPSFVISTGAGVAIPFFLVARIFRLQTVYIETGSRVTTPSLTGLISSRLVNRMYVRYPELKDYCPHAICVDG